MTDRIEPALTAEQWIEYAKKEKDPILTQRRRDFDGDHLAWLVASPDRAPAVIAIANAALPDGDPRKITWATIRLLRQEFLYHLADALASYLPPEGP